MFSFDTPESPGGLFINLCTFQVRRCSRHDSGGAGDFEWELSGRRTDQQHLFQAFGESFVELDHQRTGQVVYLHVKWTRVPVEAPPTGSEAAAAPTKLAIGVPGGFAVHDGSGGQTTLVKEHALVVFPGRQTCPYPHSELPISVTLAVDAVLAHADVAVSDTVTAWEEERRVSKYAVGLVLEDSTGRKVSRDMRQWLDQETGATDNLWLNLSDGYIGGGRRNWDGTGGSGSALRHFQAMQAQGKFYPLVVKLGTITPSGADVYSYAPDEDDMVTDPQLGDHLAHWGIDVMQCEKTEKSMAEMEIALNSTFEFDKIMESGAQLQPVSGPGFTGLYNLGNSCYMNSLLQVLKELPEFGAAHAAIAADGAIFRAAPAQPSDDLRVQMAKLAAGLLLPCPHDASRTAIRPGRFKALIAKGHREWSSSRQQDVADYLERVLTVLDDTIPTSGSALFQFDVENRDESTASGACRYSHARESVLRLYIPLDAAENLDDVAAFKERQAKRQKLRAEGATAYIAAGQPPNSNDAMEVGDTAGAVSADVEETPVPPVVPFSACMARYVSVPLDSMAVGPGNKRGPGMRTVRFATMPRYLALQMNRFDITPGSWVPHKVDVLVAPPQRLSLEHLRARPKQRCWHAITMWSELRTGSLLEMTSMLPSRLRRQQLRRHRQPRSSSSSRRRQLLSAAALPQRSCPWMMDRGNTSWSGSCHTWAPIPRAGTTSRTCSSMASGCCTMTRRLHSHKQRRWSWATCTSTAVCERPARVRFMAHTKSIMRCLPHAARPARPPVPSMSPRAQHSFQPVSATAPPTR